MDDNRQSSRLILFYADPQGVKSVVSLYVSFDFFFSQDCPLKENISLMKYLIRQLRVMKERMNELMG